MAERKKKSSEGRSKSESPDAANGDGAKKKGRAPVRRDREVDLMDAMLNPVELPVLAIRDQVVFPGMTVPLIVARERSLEAVSNALDGDRRLFVVTQRDPTIDDVNPEDFYFVGVEVTIRRTLKMPDGSVSILVEGQRRLTITHFIQMDPHIRVQAIVVEAPAAEGEELTPQMQAMLALFKEAVELSKDLPDEAYVQAINTHDAGALSDLIAYTIDLTTPVQQELLEELDIDARADQVIGHLRRELEILALQRKIDEDAAPTSSDAEEHERFLREQLKLIHKELGETDQVSSDIAALRERVEETALPEGVREKTYKELDRLEAMPTASPEVSVIQTYLDWLLALPWGEPSPDDLDIEHAKKVLDTNHFGLPKVKERILEYIAVRKLAPDVRTPILCFVGPPGVGKTSLGLSIAQALGRKFVRLSLGGIRDEAEIRGHRRTYVGALPGRILQAMRQVGTVNPVFMLDEIEKMGADFRGDPSAALLEVLDPEQNYAFSDHYLEVPYDLSHVIFITTGNTIDTLAVALRDRMEVIELPGYTEEDKLPIATRYIVPKQRAEHGLKKSNVRFTEGALRRMVRQYTREAGVRSLERQVATVCRKVARKHAEGDDATVSVSVRNLNSYLGAPQFFHGMAEEDDQVGTATGLVWTEFGGDIIAVEVTLVPGKGKLILTGKLGEVMKESGRAALSYTRVNAERLGLQELDWEKLDVHIHVPAGGVPKEGPSAGITLTSALISALTERAVRRDVAMTGEMTLRGRVLPIGGLKEKVLAAHRAGIRTIILPKENTKDLVDIPEHVRDDMTFHPVENVSEALALALHPQKKRVKATA